MSNTRRFRRRAALREKREEQPRRLLLHHLLLGVGVIVAVLAGAWGARDYQVYLAGRSEQVRSTRLGTEYLPGVAPGDPGRRASAYAGFAVAAVGLVLAVFALAVTIVDKRLAMRNHDNTHANQRAQGQGTPTRVGLRK